MRKLLCLLLAGSISLGLLGYTQTISLDQDIKNTEGSYEIILDGRPETSFTLIIAKDQQIRTANNRGVIATVTPQGNIELTNTISTAVCLRKLTINDTSKTLGSDSIETQPFRSTTSGPSYCGNYAFILTIENKQKLKFKDRTEMR